jgi:hypothetical protein
MSAFSKIMSAFSKISTLNFGGNGTPYYGGHPFF